MALDEEGSDAKRVKEENEVRGPGRVVWRFQGLLFMVLFMLFLVLLL